MRDYLSFNGTAFSSLGAYIAESNQFDAPARDVSTIEVPGRTGDLSLDNRRIRNFKRKYRLYIPSGLSALDQIKDVLYGSQGYCRLEDTLHENEYREARFLAAFEVGMSDRRCAELSIEFDCKAQRWLTSGEAMQEFTVSGVTITNPTAYPSKPLVRAYGTGTVSIGSSSLTLTGSYGTYTDIDCDIMEAYYGSTSCNELVAAEGHVFPELLPGPNTVTWTGGITKVCVTPRWWRV